MNLTYVLVVLVTLLVMEVAVTLVHKYVMHGFGWGWHQSHHAPGKGSRLEKNDWYAVVFAGATILLFSVGDTSTLTWWIALGISIYGLLYGFMHDVLIHRRLPIKWQPKSRYMRRLVQAHRLHHAVRDKDGAVSYGFLYAPPVDRLRDQVRATLRKR